MGRVEGKVAIVTGAAQGTGEVVARLLAAEGARVVLADIREEAGRQVAAEIGDTALFKMREQYPPAMLVYSIPDDDYFTVPRFV